MNILVTEQNANASAWELPQYAEAKSSGENLVKIFSECASPGASVLDAGCGSVKGTLALQAQGYNVYSCDITANGLPDSWSGPFFLSPLWKNLTTHYHTVDGLYDWIYCCEVLEYLPIQLTMLAVDQMLRVAKEGLFLSVSTQPDIYGVWLGRPLKQTIQGFAWWRDSLRELGELVDARDTVANGIFVIKSDRDF